MERFLIDDGIKQSKIVANRYKWSIENADMGSEEANDLTCIKKGKRRNRTRPVSEILLMMFRSANRDYRKAVKQLKEIQNGK